ncbi:MAG: metallophosphoesterase [Clostridia bacterium]|nr:metallophosphoesterase [Clostridia bacterium]
MKKLKIAITLLICTVLFLTVSCGGQGDAPSPDSDSTLNGSWVDSAPNGGSTDPDNTPPQGGVAEPDTNSPVENPTLEAQAEELLKSKVKITFGSDGVFKALVLADVHAGGALPTEVKANIETLVNRENPDLVIFTGDNTIVNSEENLRLALDDMVGLIEKRKIPWCHVYGNHDHEGGMSKEKMQEIFESYDYCVSKRGDEGLSGVGNYVLPVYASEEGDSVEYLVWCLDSGNYLSSKDKLEMFPIKNPNSGYNGGYDYIKADQIAWYYNSSALLESYFENKVMGIMAFHIPLRENYAAWENREGLEWDGEKNENICASNVNSGMFTAMLSCGNINAVVTGHDHINDYMLNYCGIKLCSSPNVSTTTYHDSRVMGGRVFEVDIDNATEAETRVSYLIEREEKDDPTKEILPDNSVMIDFEGNEPHIDKSGYDDNGLVGNIVTGIEEGKGRDGTNALAVSIDKYEGSAWRNNCEFVITLDKAGKLGENKYLVVWLDFSSGIEFRKACLGLVLNNQVNNPYRSDERDVSTPFYYLASGTSQWQTLSLGADGCFGKEDGQRIAGLKGYFAFPLENFLSRADDSALTEKSVVTGLYMYICLADETCVNKKFYIDNVILLEDYTK